MIDHLTNANSAERNTSEVDLGEMGVESIKVRVLLKLALIVSLVTYYLVAQSLGQGVPCIGQTLLQAEPLFETQEIGRAHV